MHISLVDVYHRLPQSMRTVTASLRGYYLRAWRYGPETEKIVHTALEREQWSEAQWKRYRAERLGYVLRRAASDVPYYRAQWSARRAKGDRSSIEQLDNWPILEKSAVRANPKAFVADDCRTRSMFHEHTSGTTGKPLKLWHTRKTIRAWYGLSEARWRRWYGVSAADRWAILGGQLVIPVQQQQPPFWVWNGGLRQLYMSSYHLSPQLVPYYLDALTTFNIRYLWGYTSSLYALAQEAIRLGFKAPNIAVAITNAEPVFPRQREAISRAFGPVRETYGMAEMVAAASECNAGRLHLWPEVGHVEVLENDHPVPPGTCGDLVCTSLLDADMPLIRYRVGDRATLASRKGCDCGRKLPIVTEIEGRKDDVVITPDGRRVGRLDPVFKADLPIREAQIIQDSFDHVRVIIVPDSGFSPSSADDIVANVRSRLGSIRADIEMVDSIPRGANGKFQAVICQLAQNAHAGAIV
jgi:phenylacetate-CoA ligase